MNDNVETTEKEREKDSRVLPTNNARLYDK
ncbi:hypothetical protein LCGC14_1838390 [marine sediment metagenome]|uniref:Uncharacterized protein n=1 Tax=marine sediment metagenome TaxID=412755 RepID=A0A0F9GE15_9ZZZZ